MEEQVKEYREKLLEGVVEMDDDAMEAYLEVTASNCGRLCTPEGLCSLCN